MTIHQFTLIIEGPDLQEKANIKALFEAGCDDATVGRSGTFQYLDFDREGETFADAVFEATDAVETAVPQARVVHLEPDELVIMVEIAARTARSRESVRLLISGQRGPGGFPPPASHFKARNRLWEWQVVAAWFADVLGEEHGLGRAGAPQFISAFNAALSLRRAARRLDKMQQRRIRKLVG